MAHLADAEAPGVSCRHIVIMPKVPILSSTPTNSTDVPGRATAAVSGSQVWTGTIGALIAKATMKDTKTTIWTEADRFGSSAASVSMRKNATVLDCVEEPSAQMNRTPPSMMSPPNSEYSRNFMAAL